LVNGIFINSLFLVLRLELCKKISKCNSTNLKAENAFTNGGVEAKLDTIFDSENIGKSLYVADYFFYRASNSAKKMDFAIPKT
jgi:hypothetical protein